MSSNNFVPLIGYKELKIEEMLTKSKTFYEEVNKRRSVRSFSQRIFPVDIIKNCIPAAGTAPSGANMQPWHFVVVSDPNIKRKIRDGAEKEEQEFYNGKAPQDWLDALAPLGTDSSKPFLEKAMLI